MTDLSEVLPNLDLKPYRHLTHSLEKNDISVAELISLDPTEIAKRCPLPLGDLKAMIRDVIRALQEDMGLVTKSDKSGGAEGLVLKQEIVPQTTQRPSVKQSAPMIKTLDPTIDQCLGGGFCTGHITEIVGESAVGKTQFVLGLLLTVQLQPPNGLGRSAIYLSTEAPLNTTRLRQMLLSHPAYESLDPQERPSLDRVHTISTNDLEIQEHIVRHQLPLAIQRFNIGLIIVDSVAANFRAEHETKNAQGLADRAADLAKLGNVLRGIARDHNVAVVVTNQVSDRFDDLRTTQDRIRSSSPMMASVKPSVRDDPLTLDHQQRFFTGWGDQPTMWYEQLKTPALGLSWANQLSARIVLKMESERQDYIGGNLWKDKKKRRFVGVVFAPWVAQTLKLIEYEITSQGIMAVANVPAAPKPDIDQDMLNPNLWFDGSAEDMEFP